jgi:hypothetical protein
VLLSKPTKLPKRPSGKPFKKGTENSRGKTNMPVRKQIVEVKSKQQVESGKWDLLFRAASSICEQEGYEFIVVTDEVIRKQPKLENVKKLWRVLWCSRNIRFFVASSFVKKRSRKSSSEIS